jgi:hypothetical protein
MVYIEKGMTASFQTLSNSLSAHSPPIRRYTAWDTDGIVK